MLIFMYFSSIFNHWFWGTSKVHPLLLLKTCPIIQSEVSQKEEHQYSVLTHKYEIQKDGNDNPVCETAKETQMLEQCFGLREGEGGMMWENGIETCKLSYVK